MKKGRHIENVYNKKGGNQEIYVMGRNEKMWKERIKRYYVHALIPDKDCKHYVLQTYLEKSCFKQNAQKMPYNTSKTLRSFQICELQDSIKQY